MAGAPRQSRGNYKFSLDSATCQQKPNFDKIRQEFLCADLKVPKKTPKKWPYGNPSPSTKFRNERYGWVEQSVPPQPSSATSKKKLINPFTTKKQKPLSGGMKRKIVEKWGKMWDNALSDMQFERIVFENNPDAEQTYKSDKHRVNDGCRKLWGIAKLNQNIITMMMKKFVSGPSNRLYTLNRVEAAQCWARIVDEQGLITEKCCADIPTKSRRKYKIASLRRPKTLEKDLGIIETSNAFKFPEAIISEVGKANANAKAGQDELCYAKAPEEEGEESETEQQLFKKNSAYWLDTSIVPPVPEGFNEEEFTIDPKNDPTGEVRKELMKAKEIARRYTRFAHIIEKSTFVDSNSQKK